jgi:hypothetical protein
VVGRDDRRPLRPVVGICSTALCVTAAIVAGQVAKAYAVEPSAQEHRAVAWRWIATVASALILIVALFNGYSVDFKADSEVTTQTVTAPPVTVRGQPPSQRPPASARPPAYRVPADATPCPSNFPTASTAPPPPEPRLRRGVSLRPCAVRTSSTRIETVWYGST